MFPIIVHEATVRVFNYYFEGQICQAMCCFKKFYRLVETFDVRDRTKACTVANQFTQQSDQTVITASPQSYKVWVEIRAKVELEEDLAILNG
jgi:hypothetical protein